MITTLDKIRLFERYLELIQGHIDPAVDVVLSKLLERKRGELIQRRDEMFTRLEAFEKQYNMVSSEFFDKFERGELGDALDFLEWSATWQMYTSVLKSLGALSPKPLSI
ncbi:MAG: hypothetical protein JW850_19390 [Thermoflexales bacterium]|nr:hypothetical protein [Thermoflexales bacterium]